MPLHAGTLNDVISIITGPVVSKGLEIMQEVQHREKPSCSITQFITTIYIYIIRGTYIETTTVLTLLKFGIINITFTFR